MRKPRGIYDALHANVVSKEVSKSDQHTKTWPDLAIGLYDRLSGRDAEISNEFENMQVRVPSGTGANAEHADWHLNGIIKIRTRDEANGPN